jgi:hypothetical protein
MKAILANFVIFLALLSSADAGKIDPKNSGTSPSGTYALGRKAGLTSDFVLRRTKPKATELMDFKLEGGDSRWPYYETVWSKDERYFVLIQSFRKESTIGIYRIDVDKVVQIKLTDLEKHMVSRERERAKKEAVKLISPMGGRWVHDVRFLDAQTLLCQFSSFWATEGSGTSDYEYRNDFKIRIKGDKASIASYDLK